MGVKERIFAYLQLHTEGLDDDELARDLGLKQRQQANICCRQLQKEELVKRQKVNGKIRNFLFSVDDLPQLKKEQESMEAFPKKPWHWEGNVQAAVIAKLEKDGYIITRCADTGSRERGKDIEAQKNDRCLWVTVKGFPEGTPRTQPSIQAGHWFKQGLFDILAWRGEDTEVELAYALPDYLRYRKLAEKVKWIESVAGFSYIWIGQTDPDRVTIL